MRSPSHTKETAELPALQFAFRFFCILIILASCSHSQSTKSVNNSPNIIFIMVDDLGKEWVSCYGAKDIKTPNIDQLAASGIQFNNVYGMPQCTPSRVTLLTGQYPYRHGWVNHWDVPRWGGGAHFDERVNPALATEIRKAGYKTCIAGKWQIDDFRVEPDALIKAGFDTYCMWTGGEGDNPPSNERYFDPYIHTKEGSKSYKGQFGPDIFKNFIIDFIKENKNDPLFIYFPMVLTHGPLTNTPADSSSTALGKHKAMVRYVDQITGEIVNTLENLGIRDNTLIIWTTDNGTSRGISGTLNGSIVDGGKAKTTEPGVCLPFIASWPAVVKPGQISEALIDFTDVFPTFMDLVGVKIDSEYQNKGKSYTIDGVSFKQVLTAEKDSKRNWILAMGGGNNARLTENGVENQYRFRDRVVRDKRFKLYISSEKRLEAFYDLLEDPDEEKNLIDSLQGELQTTHYQKLAKLITTFPDQDSDPKYIPNADQPWDVKVTAESQVWKK